MTGGTILRGVVWEEKQTSRARARAAREPRESRASAASGKLARPRLRNEPRMRKAGRGAQAAKREA
ncbi:hypothetical protein B5F41_04200 [Gordonibacter sp. An232A]|nr:hypothetical protein B5F41_04200 [Gordonibacter sp. An232A]